MAGISHRAVRSPEAPKITKQHGFAWRTARASRLSAMGFSLRIGAGDFRLDMTAEALAHRREQPQREAFRIARAETRIERGREYIRRHRLLDRRVDRPASLAGILDIAGV